MREAYDLGYRLLKRRVHGGERVRAESGMEGERVLC
jgi:hypothetical protein